LSKVCFYVDDQANNGVGSMQGLTMKSLKHHVALQPLFVIIGAGMVFVGAYVFRSATQIFYLHIYTYSYTVTYSLVTCRVVSRTPCAVEVL
jgi:hypothetical protein